MANGRLMCIGRTRMDIGWEGIGLLWLSVGLWAWGERLTKVVVVVLPPPFSAEL